MPKQLGKTYNEQCAEIDCALGETSKNEDIPQEVIIHSQVVAGPNNLLFDVYSLEEIHAYADEMTTEDAKSELAWVMDDKL